MKFIIYIFLTPFLIVKFILWCLLTLVVIVFGCVGVILNSTDVNGINSTIGDLWDNYMPEPSAD